MIETRRFCSDWWGSAEPITITSLRRDENTKCGSVKNVRYRNITCKGENGVLLFSTEDNPIQDILFENVSVEVEKTSKWPCGIYDLRPCIDYGIEEEKNSCFFIRSAENVSFRNVKTTIGDSEFYGDEINSESKIERF